MEHKNGEKAYKRDVEKKQIKEGWLIHTREFYNPFKIELTEMKNLDETLKTLGF